jgi:Condensation domain
MPVRVPLTFQQRWLWSLLGKYNDWNCTVAHAFRLKGGLNSQLLQKSLAEVIRRHGSLRTRIVTVGGVAIQQVDDPGTCHLDIAPVADVSEMPVDIDGRQLLERFAAAKLDLAAGPLVRVTLVELADRQHLLLLAFHRLIADCSSIDQVFRELWLLYGEFLHDRPPSLPTSPAQYVDYAAWQVEADPDWRTRHQAYWERRLAGATHLRWPVDKCVAANACGSVGRMSCLFGEALSVGLRELARSARTLSAAAMLAVYVAVLWRWCKQSDFVLPFKIAGRQSDHKSVVGYFTHILYLRMELTGGETLSELLRYVGNEFFQALSHQDFGKMATQAPQLLAGAFFQWVTWRPDYASRLSVPPTTGIPELTVERTSCADLGGELTAIPPGMVDVEVTFFDTPQGIHASGVYRADVFTSSTMSRFMDDLRAMAEQFVRNSQAPIATVADALGDRVTVPPLNSLAV